MSNAHHTLSGLTIADLASLITGPATILFNRGTVVRTGETMGWAGKLRGGDDIPLDQHAKAVIGLSAFM